MNTEIIILVILAIITIALIVLIEKLAFREKNAVLNMRKRQSKLSLRENVLKKKMESAVEGKAKISEKFKMETFCLQAGYRITYGEYKILSLLSAIIVPILVLMLTSNVFLALVLIIVGYLIPGQYISFVRNRRMALLQKQIGSFLNLITERYKTQRNIVNALSDCIPDFKGQEPMYSELKKTLADINVGVTPVDAFDALARRTGDDYIKRFKNFYAITAELGTEDSRENILGQAFIQYDENRKLQEYAKKEISGPVREAYIMLMAIPVMCAYQATTSPTYTDFMLHTMTGKVGTAFIACIIMGAVWFINSKIGAPIK